MRTVSATSRYRRLKRSHKMTKLLETLSNWFKPALQSELEAFINSKHPQSAADVDHWTREYQAKYWARGL